MSVVTNILTQSSIEPGTISLALRRLFLFPLRFRARRLSLVAELDALPAQWTMALAGVAIAGRNI